LNPLKNTTLKPIRKADIPAETFSYSKLKKQNLTDKKRVENHEKFNKEIYQANHVLEQLLETCNKMLSNSQVGQESTPINDKKPDGDNKEINILMNSNIVKDEVDDQNQSNKILLTNKGEYEDNFEFYSAEFLTELTVINCIFQNI